MMLFKRSFGLTRSLFILYIHKYDRLGSGMLTMETAVIPGLYLIDSMASCCVSPAHRLQIWGKSFLMLKISQAKSLYQQLSNLLYY